MANAYGYGVDPSATVATRLLVNSPTSTENANGASIPGFTLGGYYNSDVLAEKGTRGYYWSRTVRSRALSERFAITRSSVMPSDYSHKASGRAVRCLLKE